ncbi:DUF6279 family lipoprotein [Rhodoferax sp.]|uniref:DUF6279 family lipoprotein n=1 Tax=Rhodoferax sp. TaxID=50421 RepID=UPI0025D78600|nr:DUF6279 family lipoprotein [Rhodoferax sp.]
MPFITPEKLLRPWAFARRWCAIIGLLVAATALSGCGAVRLAYNNAPDLAYWWIDGYLDLDSPQSLKLRKDLQSLQSWHRQEELPLAADMLKNLQAASQGPVSADQVCQLSRYLETRFQAVIDRAAPTAFSLAPTLTVAQLDHLVRAWDKRNQEWREEWLDGSPQERLNRRLKSTVERAEGFYGRLSDSQKQLLRTQLAASQFDPALQYQETQRRQKDIVRTLRELKASPATELHQQAEVRALFVRSTQSPDPAFQQYTERVRTGFCEAAAELHNATTPGQRLKLQQTLQGYESDVRALMQR